VAFQIWVKVIGFSDAERNSLNTLFRLSATNDTTYQLWNTQSSSAPHVALIDGDSYEADLEVASPSFNTHLKCIYVGANPESRAWRFFERPVDWSALVLSLHELFESRELIDLDLNLDTEAIASNEPPPGLKISLLIGPNRQDHMYLRARLSLAGLTQVDEAHTAEEALAMLAERHYGLVVLSLDMADADPWSLVQTLKTPSLRSSPSVLLASQTPSWSTMERAERMGCAGLLEIPFNPRQVQNLLLKI
jgi:CheY-like chemotaxis protein